MHVFLGLVPDVLAGGGKPPCAVLSNFTQDVLCSEVFIENCRPDVSVIELIRWYSKDA